MRETNINVCFLCGYFYFETNSPFSRLYADQYIVVTDRRNSYEKQTMENIDDSGDYTATAHDTDGGRSVCQESIPGYVNEQSLF